MAFSGADGKYLIYGCRNILVFRSLDDNLKSFVYDKHPDAQKITAIKQTPDNKMYAFGDDAGTVN